MHPRVEGRSGPDDHTRFGRLPSPAERFPGEAVLEDLRHAADTEVPAILARFAAVRAVRLMDLAAPARPHAVEAALAHLEAVGPDWSEGHWLRGPIEGSAGSKCLERAARAASARGHEAGARALRQEVHRRQWARLGVLPHWLS